jgi:PilZ domain
MRKFNYRVPRFPVDLPVLLTFGESTQVGRCLEISVEGMKLEAGQPLSPDSRGTVHLTYLGIAVELSIRVAHAGSAFDGVTFVYDSEEQRDKVSQLVSLLARPTPRSGPVVMS